MSMHRWIPFTHVGDVRVVAHLVVLRCDHDGCPAYIADKYSTYSRTANLAEWSIGERDYCQMHKGDAASKAKR